MKFGRLADSEEDSYMVFADCLEELQGKYTKGGNRGILRGPIYEIHNVFEETVETRKYWTKSIL
jgi:hypothetical protein